MIEQMAGVVVCQHQGRRRRSVANLEGSRESMPRAGRWGRDWREKVSLVVKGLMLLEARTNQAQPRHK